MVNTAGGLTGGDHFDISVKVEQRAVATMTSQACEKIYRASDRAARLAAMMRAMVSAIASRDLTPFGLDG